MIGAANTANMKNPDESKYCSPANRLNEKQQKESELDHIMRTLNYQGLKIALDAMLYLMRISKVGSKSA